LIFPTCFDEITLIERIEQWNYNRICSWSMTMLIHEDFIIDRRFGREFD
jgi:hypothetical protein